MSIMYAVYLPTHFIFQESKKTNCFASGNEEHITCEFLQKVSFTFQIYYLVYGSFFK